ncbi:MAG: hypothetical protein Ct9H300mP1_33170 [Planctomycetaceae bacterium]|nr:MAG: hypothetical protein Ct9H300mP1_33170 [Planctomycetaceae bacterium]
MGIVPFGWGTGSLWLPREGRGNCTPLKTAREGKTVDLADKHPDRVRQLAIRWKQRMQEYRALALSEPP